MDADGAVQELPGLLLDYEARCTIVALGWGNRGTPECNFPWLVSACFTHFVLLVLFDEMVYGFLRIDSSAWAVLSLSTENRR